MKNCSLCKKDKEYIEFYKVKTRNGYSSHCRKCHIKRCSDYTKSEIGAFNKRKASFKHNYGLCIEEYYKLLKEQNGVCAVCFTFSKTRRTEHLFVDHDHKTGKVRGLLCRDCNIGLGNLRDSIFIIRSFEQYLIKYLTN